MVEETTNEIWKDIPEYENLYQISSIGRVKSLERNVKHMNYYYTRKERILKPCKNKSGYIMVILNNEGKKKGMAVHRLVASAFIPNPFNLPEVNHKDENPSNNNVENLEWCTREYNNNYGTRNERSAKSNTNHPKRSKKIICIETGKVYPSTQEIERQLGFNHSNISACCKKKYGCKTVGNYHWQYVEQ